MGKDHELFKRVERNYNDTHDSYAMLVDFMDGRESEMTNESRKTKWLPIHK